MHNSCCIIVGAGPGLGMNIARRFAQGGFEIALIARDQGRLEGLSWELNSEGYTSQGFAADAAAEHELQSAFDRIAEWKDNIGVLIYNVAEMIPDNVLDLTPDSIMKKMALNLGGAITSVNQALPFMRRRGGGTILITGGGLGLEPYPDWASLSAGKAALRSYSIALHKALYPENIHVAVIAVCGIVTSEGLFASEKIAEKYWQLHAESKPHWQRELIYLPEDADPYYNDTAGVYRLTSLPLSSD